MSSPSPNLNIRVQPHERDVINRAAEAEHLSTSAWVRQTCLKRADEVLAEEYEEAEEPEAAG